MDETKPVLGTPAPVRTARRRPLADPAPPKPIAKSEADAATVLAPTGRPALPVWLSHPAPTRVRLLATTPEQYDIAIKQGYYVQPSVWHAEKR